MRGVTTTYTFDGANQLVSSERGGVTTRYAYDAAGRFVRYAKDHDLAKAWNLRESGGTVTLQRIAVVFRGGDIALCEEI